MYSINGTSGVLTTLGTVRARPGARALDMSGGSTCATYVPLFAYVADQNSNNITGFSIDPNSGVLAAVPGSPFPAGSGPLGVTADPTGKFAYVANTNSGNVSAFGINASNVPLTPATGSPFLAGAPPFAPTVDSSSPLPHPATL